MVASANAQTLSLGERVTRLEQQQSQQQGSVSLVNQVQDLQSQLQEMQGRFEELQHQVQELQKQNKDHFTDLDSRLGKLEGGNPAPTAAASSGAPAAASTTAPPAPASTTAPAPVSNAVAQPAYDAAFKLLRGGDYVGASRGFRDFVQKYPDSALAPNAYYWLGESYYVTQNYRPALDAFQTLLKQYPKSQKAPDALLKIGYSQAEMKKLDAARATLESVVKQYPGTTVARLAQARLRELKLQTPGQ
ncbi:MAG: tol-pal system protein YbgF [Pseudomonadota bacterium]|nr:tol-pal system protein YbgF [Pseudomonadota bacterium]